MLNHELLQQIVELMDKCRRVINLTAFTEYGLIEQDQRQIGKAGFVHLVFELGNQRMAGVDFHHRLAAGDILPSLFQDFFHSAANPISFADQTRRRLR